jgi:hypothetical protein
MLVNGSFADFSGTGDWIFLCRSILEIGGARCAPLRRPDLGSLNLDVRRLINFFINIQYVYALFAQGIDLHITSGTV